MRIEQIEVGGGIFAGLDMIKDDRIMREDEEVAVPNHHARA